jgi:hypothetical protein
MAIGRIDEACRDVAEVWNVELIDGASCRQQLACARAARRHELQSDRGSHSRDAVEGHGAVDSCLVTIEWKACDDDLRRIRIVNADDGATVRGR